MSVLVLVITFLLFKQYAYGEKILRLKFINNLYILDVWKYVCSEQAW